MVELWLRFLTYATEEIIPTMIINRTTPLIQVTTPRRGAGMLAEMLTGAGAFSERGSELVGLGSRRLVVTFSVVLLSSAVGSSEESVAMLPVTETPHWRQNLASGNKSAPQLEHCETLMTSIKIRPTFPFGKLLSLRLSLSQSRCGARAFCDTQVGRP